MIRQTAKTKKISVLLKTQNGVKEIPIDDLESSSMGQMVHHRGLEPDPLIKSQLLSLVANTKVFAPYFDRNYQFYLSHAD